MAKTYKVGFAVRASNALVTFFLRLGVPMPNGMSLLTVRGRKSGEPRTTPVAMSNDAEGRRILIAPFGAVNWVRNLRAAAGEATLTNGRRKVQIQAVEIKGREAADVMKQMLEHNPPKFILEYFEVPPDAPVEDFEREIAQHPVFQILPK
jgi:deazaflavin-dependent oxidoreductase (nitroreductase family)